MDESVKRVIEQCAQQSQAGAMKFGDVVAALKRAGVESYQADYRRAETTYYLPVGTSHAFALPVPDLAIPQTFEAQALRSAIRAAQRGEIMYPEFLRLSMADGCVGYIVWIAGRNVSYFGRRGETHVEVFTSSM